MKIDPLLCVACVCVSIPGQAYIIKSRVREADGLLLVQPYSPDLFRLGDLPGPRLLMEALRGKATPQELKKEWKAVEKEKQNGPSRRGLCRAQRGQFNSKQ